MKHQFENSNSTWVRYSRYEWKTAANGKEYLTVGVDAKPQIYDPLKVYEDLVLNALYIGRLGMSKAEDSIIKEAIKAFAEKYGLFGLMTALPTTAEFLNYEAVYLPKNHFIKAETIKCEDYLSLFFPFNKPDVRKKDANVSWEIADDKEMMALALTMDERPIAVNLCFQRNYAENYEWLKQQFIDWTFNASTTYLYYADKDVLDRESRLLMKQSIGAFGGNAPTYHIMLLDKPTLVWDFHSLLLGIQMMMSFMLTDEQNPLKVCKKCSKFFVASRPSAVFCSPRCKNQFNVYKNRAKSKDSEE